MKKKSTRNWSNAPLEIIGLIAERLHSIEDCVSFRGVCTSWRYAVLNNPHCTNVSSKTLPWMMFPCYSSGKAHNFCSLSMNKFYKLTLPDDIYFVLSGSHYGWLVLFHGRNMAIFNPLTRVCLPLPPISTPEGYTSDGNYLHFDKVVLVSTAEDRFLAFGFLPRKLAFTRPGYKAWTAVNVPLKSYDDILPINNQFYVVDTNGLVTEFAITGHSPAGIEFASPPADLQIEVSAGDMRTFYLVEILGRMYMVMKLKFRVDEYRYSHVFRVFKLDLGSREWEEVFTLGEYAIFVDYTTSFSLLVSKYPQSRSSIYFMDHYFGHGRGGRNIGIFNLQTRVLVDLDPEHNSAPFFCSQFWFMPNLC